MSAVLVISDEEEETPVQTTKVRGSNARARGANARGRGSNGGYQNVYEDGGVVQPKERLFLKMFDDERNNVPIQIIDDESETIVGDITYVPDEDEEEQFLINPIRCMSHAIIFGADLGPSPKEFPYEKLEKIEEHLVKRLKNISYATEKNVWEFVLNELRCIRFAYDRIKDIDVRIKFDYCYLFLFFLMNLLLLLFNSSKRMQNSI